MYTWSETAGGAGSNFTLEWVPSRLFSFPGWSSGLPVRLSWCSARSRPSLVIFVATTNRSNFMDGAFKRRIRFLHTSIVEPPPNGSPRRRSSCAQGVCTTVTPLFVSSSLPGRDSVAVRKGVDKTDAPLVEGEVPRDVGACSVPTRGVHDS